MSGPRSSSFFIFGILFDDGVSRLTSWLSFVVSNCEFVTFPLVSWIFYVFVLYCVCYVFVRVCLYVLCGHLLGKG